MDRAFIDHAEKLIARLASGKAIPAVVLLGTDSYLRELCRKQIVEACVPEGAREWAVARIRGDAAGWDEALERVQTMPMLAPRQVIIVEDGELVEKLGDDAREGIVTALSKYLDSPAPFSVLLIEAAALDRRQKFSQAAGRESAGGGVDDWGRIGRGARRSDGERTWNRDGSRGGGIVGGKSEWRAGAHANGN